MSDNMSLSLQVKASDEASPTIRKIIGEIDALRNSVTKTAAALRGLSFDNLKSPNAPKPNQSRSSSPSVAFAQEQRDANRALKDRFQGITKVAALARREAASNSKAQAVADRAATASLRAKIAGTAKVNSLRVAAERTVADEASKADKAATTALRDKLRGLATVDKLRSASEAKALTEAKAKATAKAKVEKQGITALRTKLATMARVARQRLASEQAVAREQARTAADGEQEHAASLKRQIAGHRYLHGLRTRMDRQAARERQDDHDDLVRHTRKAGSHAGDAASRFSRTGTMAAAAMVGGTVAAARKGITVRGDVDAAETNLRIFGSEPASGNNPGSKMTADDVFKIRKGWLDRTAVDNGLSPADAIRAHTEVLKAGIAPTKARSVTETLMGAGAAMDLDLSDTVKLAGKVMTNRPDLDVKRFANSFAIAAGTTAADPREMIQGYQRGMGALAGTNMSPEDLTAFIATGQGAGIQAGKVGNFVAETASTLSTAGNERGQRRKDLDLAGRMTGFGNARGMSAAMAKDAAGTMETLFERMSKMDEKTRALVSRRLGGREWDDEELQFVNSIDTLKRTRKAVKDPRNADYLDRAKAEKMNSWGGMWSKSLSTFKLFWEKFGAGFDKILRDVNGFIDSIGKSFDFDKITSMVRSALDGIKDGLGIKSWSEGLNGLFGDMKAADFGGILVSIRQFFKGFVDGIRVFTDTIRSFASAILGGDVSTERLGKLTGAILAFAVGMFVVAPIAGLLASITSALVGLGFAASAAWRVLKGLGIVGGAAAGAGAVSGAAGGVAGAAAAGGLAAKAKGIIGKAGKALGVVGLADLANDFGALKMPDGRGGFARSVVEFLDPGLADRMFGPKPPGDGKPVAKNDNVTFPGVRAWSEPPAKLKQDDADTKAKARSVVPSIPVKTAEPEGIPSNVAVALEHGNFLARLRAILVAFLDRLETILANVSLDHKATKTKAEGNTAEAVKATEAKVRLAALGAGGSAVSGLGSSLSTLGGSDAPGSSSFYRSGGGARAGQRVSNFGGAYSPAPNSMAGQTFATKAPGIMANLMKDFALTKEQAAGILGNLGHESAGMTAYQEGNPRGGGRGGAGWAQWTGPRRRAFEAWSARNGLDPRSDAANYGFLKHELTGSHAGALASLKRQTTADGATIDFERTYEAAGVKHYGSRLGYARRAMGLDPNSAAPNPAASSAGGNSPSGGAADVASRYLGMHELRNRVELSSFLGQDPAGNANAWCASFVNASLKAVGQAGTRSGIANSFLRWGKGITAEMAERGDVLVEHRGRGVDGRGGHVGIATGNKRINPKTGRLELEAISGNSSDAVKVEWEDAAKLAVRRSTQAATGINRAVDKVGKAVETAKAIGDGMTSTGWRKASDASLVAPDAQRSTGTDNPVRTLTEGAFKERAKALAAASPANAESLAKAAPTPEARGIVSNASRGAGGNGASITAPITIHHAGDSAQLANQVQRRIQEAGNWQSRDQDFHSV